MNTSPPTDAPATFKPGDRVMLRSGGPTLTVVDVGTHTGLVWCQWIHEGTVTQATFPAALLRPPFCQTGLAAALRG